MMHMLQGMLEGHSGANQIDLSWNVGQCLGRHTHYRAPHCPVCGSTAYGIVGVSVKQNSLQVTQQTCMFHLNGPIDVKGTWRAL